MQNSQKKYSSPPNSPPTMGDTFSKADGSAKSRIPSRALPAGEFPSEKRGKPT
jgi:hypothetical protein